MTFKIRLKGDLMNYDTIKFMNLEGFAYIIKSIDLTKTNNVLSCNLTLKKRDEVCPSCQSKDYTVHGYYTKKITHSISNSSPCFILYKARRYRCKYCGKVFYETNPFSLEGDQTSTYTILAVLDTLRSHTSTFTSVAAQFNLTKQNVINIFDNYVDCGRKKFPKIISIDEFYTSKLSRYKYACTILDFKSKEIVEIYSSRRMNHLANKFTILPDSERNNVKIIIIDMWEPYRDLAKRYFKKAIVAVDSFHVIKHLNDAVIKIRLKVMNKYNKRTSTLKSNDMYYYMLKKFHYFFVKNFEDIYQGYIKIPKIHPKWKRDEILKYLLANDDDLKYSYRLKEKYREFNLTADYDNCEEEFDSLIYDFNNSHLEEFREFGRLLLNWRTEIINSLIRVEGRRLSNSAIEGVNSRIKTIIKNANGYTNFNRLRNKIIFSINKDVAIKAVPIKTKK